MEFYSGQMVQTICAGRGTIGVTTLAGSITCTGKFMIVFDTDTTIQLNGAGTTMVWLKGVQLCVKGITTLKTSEASSGYLLTSE